MKHLKNIFVALFIATLIASCSSDDDGDSTPAGGDHTYSIEVTSGFLQGTHLSGSVPNQEFIGLYVEDTQQGVVLLTQGLQGESQFIFGGGVTIKNGQALPLTNTIDGFDGSSLLIGFEINNETYTFESMSGTCNVNNLSKYSIASGTGIASYKLTFSGTFRQANTGGLDEDAPLVQISGTVDVKRSL